MGESDGSVAGVDPQPSIPEDGLATTLRAWSGQGRLWSALAMVDDPSLARQWSRRDVERRACRVLLEHLEPTLRRWPTRIDRWLDALPAESARARWVTVTPGTMVAWPETAARYGWPPSAFVERPRLRVADTTLVTTFRWTLEYLARVLRNAREAYGDTAARVQLQLDTAFGAMRVEPLRSSVALAPTRTEIRALQREGAPWHVVAPVAEAFRLPDEALAEFARMYLYPDDAIRWRLFHLAVLGQLLLALRNLGCELLSLRPLAGASTGPALMVKDGERLWELWFEAAGVWSHRGVKSPYGEAARGVRKAERALGADLLLIREKEKALVIECKYSWRAEVVARGGYEQVLAYAAEMKSRLVSEVVSVVVGPEEVVQQMGTTTLLLGPVSIIPPSKMASVVEDFLRKSP